MSQNGTETEEEATSDGGMAALVKMLLEERRARDEELGRERERRERVETERAKQMAEQMEILRAMLDPVTPAHTGHKEGGRSLPSHPLPQDKIVLTESDDIETFLTTFERLMTLYHVDETQWIAKLAPQLTGRIQQAYAVMLTEDAFWYKEVKKTILRHYEINEQTYRQRFRATCPKHTWSWPHILGTSCSGNGHLTASL